MPRKPRFFPTGVPQLFRSAIGVMLLLLPFFVFAGDEPVELDLRYADIEAVRVGSEVAWVKLGPAATARLAMLTQHYHGQYMRVTLEGAPVLQSRIVAPVDSGVLQIANPSPELIPRLGEKPAGSWE